MSLMLFLTGDGFVPPAGTPRLVSFDDPKPPRLPYGDDRSNTAVRSANTALVVGVLEQGPATANEVALLTGIRVQSVRRILWDLVDSESACSTGESPAHFFLAGKEGNDA